MGDPNRICHSLTWEGTDDEQIVRSLSSVDSAHSAAKDASGEIDGSSTCHSAQTRTMSIPDQTDLTPRRGLVYDAPPV